MISQQISSLGITRILLTVGVAGFLAISQYRTANAMTMSYGQCMKYLREDPDTGFEVAIQWQSLGGGYPARHCAALALSKLGLYDEAAKRLESLADHMAGSEPWQYAELLVQAANAWVLWGNDSRAITLLNAAINAAPGMPSSWIDRARLHMTEGRFFEALGDLNQAIKLAPLRAEAFVFRGNTYRLLDDHELAKLDLYRAVELDPTNAEAWLELGNLEKDTANTDVARSYWLKVRTLVQDGPVAEAAMRNIEQLDVRIEGGHGDRDAVSHSALPRISGDIEMRSVTVQN